MVGWEEIATGTRDDLTTGLREYDSLIPEGSRGYLKLNTITSIHPGIVSSIEGALRFAGIPEVDVTYNNHALNIFWRKSFPWLIAIVGVIVPLLLILAIVLISWQLFRESPTMAPAVIGAIAIIGIGIAVLAAKTILLRRRTI